MFRRWVRHFQILNEHDGFLIESDSTLMHVSTASHGAPVCSAYMIAYRRLHVSGSCGPCRNVCCMSHVACSMLHTSGGKTLLRRVPKGYSAVLVDSCEHSVSTAQEWRTEVIVSTMLRVLRVLGAAQEWRTEVIERVLTEGDSLSEVST